MKAVDTLQTDDDNDRHNSEIIATDISYFCIGTRYMVHLGHLGLKLQKKVKQKCVFIKHTISESLVKI